MLDPVREGKTPRDAAPPHEGAAAPTYLHPFSRDVADELVGLLERIQAHASWLIEHWQSLCASDGGTDRSLAAQLLEEIYVPRCRSAIECLARGDTAGFMAYGRALGSDLATVGVPFAVVVAHATYLKDACAKALADDPSALGHALLALDRPMSCFLTAAADGYYRGLRDEAVEDVAEDWAVPTPEPTGAGTFHGLVGASPPMQRVFAQIARTASSIAPILLLGETGTGKELAARAIHQAGPHRGGPFIALNCAALPRELIESELFGHRRGAFSGALTECLGLFRAAEGGTLLLDEITEMGPELQAKLLRVLQERTVRPVGSTTEEAVDVRIIAATNRDPELALRSGVLRQDLYYRLSVTTLTLPSLRARREDIPALVEHHLATLNQRAGEGTPHVRGVAPDAMRLLMVEPWPGNVRELFNVVENAFTMGTTIIGADALELATGRCDEPLSDTPQLRTFEQHERTLIERTLEHTRGNKVAAARELGISRKKLYARMTRYGLMTLLAGMLVAA